MIRWVRISDLAIELGLAPHVIWRFYKQGKLKGIGDRPSNLRIIDPGPEFADEIHKNNLDRFNFITTRELADVLGISFDAVHKRLQRDKLLPSGCVMPEDAPHLSNIKRGRRQPTFFFNRIAVRSYLAQVEQRSGQQKYQYSAIVVRWLKGWLASRKTQAEVLDELIRQAADVPEPERTVLVKALWDKFDEIESLLRQCDRMARGSA